jgi:hypothetical protein
MAVQPFLIDCAKYIGNEYYTQRKNSALAHTLIITFSYSKRAKRTIVWRHFPPSHKITTQSTGNSYRNEFQVYRNRTQLESHACIFVLQHYKTISKNLQHPNANHALPIIEEVRGILNLHLENSAVASADDATTAHHKLFQFVQTYLVRGRLTRTLSVISPACPSS